MHGQVLLEMDLLVEKGTRVEKSDLLGSTFSGLQYKDKQSEHDLQIQKPHLQSEPGFYSCRARPYQRRFADLENANLSTWPRVR